MNILEFFLLNKISDYISIFVQILFLIYLKLFVDRNRIIFNVDFNVKYRIYRIYKIIDDIIFNNQVVMIFILEFNYVVKNRIVIVRKKYFKRQQIFLVEMSSFIQKENLRSM